MGFEEHIKADKTGYILDECNPMPSYRCECGNEQISPSDFEIDDISCYDCGEYGKLTLIPSEN